MIGNRRNISPGIFVLVLMIVFISFFQKGKERHHEPAPSGISCSNNPGLRAVIVPGISQPGTEISRAIKQNTGSSHPDCIPARELILNKLISHRYTLYRLDISSTGHAMGFLFPRKIPEQAKSDDVPAVI